MWVPAQKISHKLRGTVACFHLDCTKSADTLDAALQLQIVRDKGRQTTDGGEEVKALCVTFLAEVEAVVAFFTWEQATDEARRSTRRRTCSEV